VIFIIYITGDTHADFHRFKTENFPEQKHLTKDDYVIICGDFGGVFNYIDSGDEERYWLDWLNDRPFTTLFVDGNHECLHKDTEILTTQGWIRIEDIYNSPFDYEVASVDLNTHYISYSKPLNKIKKYADYLYDFNGTNYRQCVTENHEIIVNGKKVKAKDVLDSELSEKDFRFEIKNDLDSTVKYSNGIIEILTMIVMDGTVVEEKKYQPNSKKVRIQFHFKKIKKIIYLQNLLDSNNIKYSISYMSDKTTYIRIYGDYARYLYGLLHYKKEIPNEWRKLSDVQFRYFLNALLNSDGAPLGNNAIRWTTTSKNDVDIISEQCVLHNYDLNVSIRENNSGYTNNCKTQYLVSIGKNKRLTNINIEKIIYQDYVYCLTMKDGTLITRYKMRPCITGNCFTRLKQWRRIDYHGGKAHRIRDSIYHLMRGYVFEFDGKSFFTFGGAKSHDIQDGILRLENYKSLSDMIKDYKMRTIWLGQMIRMNEISWWKDEQPSAYEMQRGIDNLKKVDFKVDYVITHTCPQRICEIMSDRFKPEKLSLYFDKLIDMGLQFEGWHYGHFHKDVTFDNKYHLHYRKIEKL